MSQKQTQFVTTFTSVEEYSKCFTVLCEVEFGDLMQGGAGLAR